MPPVVGFSLFLQYLTRLEEYRFAWKRFQELQQRKSSYSGTPGKDARRTGRQDACPTIQSLRIVLTLCERRNSFCGCQKECA